MKDKKINFKKLFLIIFLTILVGSFFSFFVSMDFYKDLVKPPLSPPGIVFPIAWVILDILMSISLYIVTNDDEDHTKYYAIYIGQLIVNSLWTLIFFGFKFYLFGFIWVLFLIVLVLIMTYMFFKKNKVAAYLLIPYILWLIFASYLNIQIYLLN